MWAGPMGHSGPMAPSAPTGSAAARSRREMSLEELLEDMSIWDLAGQIVQAEQADTTREQIGSASLGSVFFAGDHNPGAADPASWSRETERLQREAI